MRLPLLITAALLTLSGCGGGGDTASTDAKPEASSPASSPTSSPTSTTWQGYEVPFCSAVWVEGGTVPEEYDGCMDGDTLQAGISYDCDDGRTLLGSDVGWGFVGAEVHLTGTDDPAYGRAFDACKP